MFIRIEIDVEIGCATTQNILDLVADTVDFLASHKFVSKVVGDEYEVLDITTDDV